MKKKSKKLLAIITILLLAIIFTVVTFIFLSIFIEKIVAPKNYLFYETNFIASKIMIFAVVFMIFIIAATILKKLKIKNMDGMNIYYEFFKKHKFVAVIIFILSIYTFVFSNTFVTENAIIYHNFLHPRGIIYQYSDIDKVKTGFGNKIFTFTDYKRKGEFYYQIYIENKIITFSVPSPNDEVKRYKDDSYLELEEFDQKLMELNISKESSKDNYKNCLLDQKYCNRFLKIIENK